MELKEFLTSNSLHDASLDAIHVNSEMQKYELDVTCSITNPFEDSSDEEFVKGKIVLQGVQEAQIEPEFDVLKDLSGEILDVSISSNQESSDALAQFEQLTIHFLVDDYIHHTHTFHTLKVKSKEILWCFIV